MADLTPLFKALSDETRLRLLSLLREGELAVGELQRVLRGNQSTLSTQLGNLREQGFVASRKEGQKVFYRLASGSVSSPQQKLLEAALEASSDARWQARDQRELQKVLAERSESSRAFFDALSVQNQMSPGQTWEAMARGFLRLIPSMRLVDLGCGSGRWSRLFSESGHSVVGVDLSEEQIKLARERQIDSDVGREKRAALPSRSAKRTSVFSSSETKGSRFLVAPMEATGLPDGEADAVLISHSLHHAAKPPDAIAEAFRLLVPGGRLLLLDLPSHEEDWLRSRFGDFWLGFDRSDLERWMHTAGFETPYVELTSPSGEYPDLEGLLAVAHKPLSPRSDGKSSLRVA
jgi:ArsR family transcriptional regulator